VYVEDSLVKNDLRRVIGFGQATDTDIFKINPGS
jgi:hypothetical protein